MLAFVSPVIFYAGSGESRMVDSELAPNGALAPMPGNPLDVLKNCPPTERLDALFAADPERSGRFTREFGDILFDFSKTHISPKLVETFDQLARASGLLEERDRMLAGELVNSTERRPALHTALRNATPPVGGDYGSGISDQVRREREELDRMLDSIRSGQLTGSSGKPLRQIIHLGIGGSALGPALLSRALGYQPATSIELHCVANVDAHALQQVMNACEPDTTLIVAASKTFTTTETLMNARTLLDWLDSAGIEDPAAHLIAVTAAPAQAREFGVREDRILTFPEWVGGRYSIWSAISFAALARLPSTALDELLAGAAEMDRHFASEPVESNLPLLAAMLDVWYGIVIGAQTRALFVYDTRLADLLPYLQQLEMENNGKRVTRFGTPVNWQTSPVLWGGTGTDAQHAVFQLLHQGTVPVPTEFVAVSEAQHPFDQHHRCLLANCIAQSAALMRGRSTSEAKQALPHESEDIDALAQAKTFPGNRPSTTLLLQRLTPRTLGALLAFYEHRSFVSGTLWQLNVFDQMGVELGKELATTFTRALQNPSEMPDDLDPSSAQLLRRALGR